MTFNLPIACGLFDTEPGHEICARCCFEEPATARRNGEPLCEEHAMQVDLEREVEMEMDL